MREISVIETTCKVKNFCDQECNRVINEFYHNSLTGNTREQTLALVYGFCRVKEFLDELEKEWFINVSK